MKTTITEQEKQSYDEQGFVVIPEFLDSCELAQWRNAVDQAIANRGSQRLADRDSDSDYEYYNKVFTQRVNLWMDNPGIREIMLDERLGQMAADLADTGAIRVWHDQALVKEPWANPTAWHLDNPYWSFTNRQSLSIWVALDDATLQNGCLYFMPGSHKEAEIGRNIGITENIGGLFEVYPEWRNRQPIAAPMQAGDCSFHNGWTAHGAGANMTPGRRRAMTCGYMPAGCTFNGIRNILPEDYFSSLIIGDSLESNELTPMIFHRG